MASFNCLIKNTSQLVYFFHLDTEGQGYLYADWSDEEVSEGDTGEITFTANALSTCISFCYYMSGANVSVSII